ncbi:MAG: hypothetical protein M1839_008615 [Geoglossum umbratile]|nr:MAG: hypothetical protein M1839_008615 [Geoglossum umbratile]
MALTGTRFDIDLSSDDENTPPEPQQELQQAQPLNILSFGTVGVVKERVPSGPATAPTLANSASGFPAHKKRSRISTFKRQRAAPPTQPRSNADGTATTTAASLQPDQTIVSAFTPLINGSSRDEVPAKSFEELEKQRIDEENKKQLASMSDEEIAHERQELLAGLSPSLLERLLKRANLDDGRADTGVEMGTDHDQDVGATIAESPAVPGPPPASQPAPPDPDAEPILPPPDLAPASSTSLPPPQPKIHFPAPPTPPTLDPSSPTFLTTLHEKYFPTLPTDPSKLAWMAPLPSTSAASSYSPSHPALPASALRFDFNGRLLPPRTALDIPVTKGLHHHGDAPEAAGYTIPELARLARSAFPAQRCVAFQTLGRILYRLGKGEWGPEGSEMAMGLWRCVAEGRVLEGLQEAVEREKHLSAKSYAVEAIWNWQQGGGQLWKAG